MLDCFPGSAVTALYRDEFAQESGVVASRRIVSASSRRPGAGPTAGVVYRSRTAGLTEEQRRLGDLYARSTGAEREAARMAYARELGR